MYFTVITDNTVMHQPFHAFVTACMDHGGNWGRTVTTDITVMAISPDGTVLLGFLWRHVSNDSKIHNLSNEEVLEF